MMKIKRPRGTKPQTDRLNLPSMKDSISLEGGDQKLDSHKVSLGPDSKR